MSTSNVPVLQSVRAAVEFRRLHWRAVAGVLALLALWGTAFDTLGSAEAGPWRFVGALGAVVLSIAANGALLRLAFADEHPGDPEFVPGPQGLQWGRMEWRLLGVMALLGFLALLAVLMLLFVIMLILVGAGVGAITAETSAESVAEALGPGPRAAIVLIVMAGVGALIFVGMRLMLAQPATAANRRMMIFQTWPLTRGQFWRLLAAALMITIPVLVAGFVAGFLASFIATLTGVPQESLGAPETALIALIPNVVAAFVYVPMNAGLMAYLYRGLRTPDVE